MNPKSRVLNRLKKKRLQQKLLPYQKLRIKPVPEPITPKCVFLRDVFILKFAVTTDLSKKVLKKRGYGFLSVFPLTVFGGWWGRPDLNRRPLPRMARSQSLRVSLVTAPELRHSPKGQQTRSVLLEPVVIPA